MKAYGSEMEISHKHAREIAVALKGMQVSKAKKFLENVVELKQVVPLRRFNQELPHRKGIMAGRWPKKAAGQMLKVLRSAQANAEYKGKSEASLFVESIIVSRGRFKRMYGAARALGRKGRQRGRTANVRVTLVEKQIEEPKAKPKKVEKKEELKKEVKATPEVKEEKPKEKKGEEKPKTKDEKKAEKWLKSVR